MKRIKNSARDALRHAARHMPPLYHTMPNEQFSYERSQVCAWLVQQPEALEYLFRALHSNTTDDPIVYDREAGQWYGVDYKED